MHAKTLDPYGAGIVKKDVYATAKRRMPEGVMVVVIDLKLDNRRLQLIPTPSRAVLRGEIHELLVTDEEGAKPGTEVNSIGVIGFMEFTLGGMIAAGDDVFVGRRLIGTIAGFDETHCPNHINIVLKSTRKMSGSELGIELEEEVTLSRGSPALST